ncbi:24041_t:CDS:2, partial [Racocetra persica]
YAPSTSTGNKGLIIVNNLDAAKKAIKLIIDQSEGGSSSNKSINATIDVKVSGTIEVSKKIKISGAIKEAKEKETIEGTIERILDDSSFSDPYTQDIRSYTDPNIDTTIITFDAANSYLMLLLQVVWRTDRQKKKILIIRGMPALMYGVLKPIATFFA